MARATKKLREEMVIPESVEGCVIVDIAFDFGYGIKYDVASLEVGEAMAIAPSSLRYVKSKIRAMTDDSLRFFIRFNDIKTIVFVCRRA